MKKFSDIEVWKEVESFIDEPRMKNVFSAASRADLLITEHYDEIRIWNIKDLPNIKFVSALKLPSTYCNIKLAGDTLYLYKRDYKGSVAIVDLSNIEKPVLSNTYKVNDLSNGTYSDGLIYLTAGNEVLSLDKEGHSNAIISIDEQANFNDYPSDIAKVNQTLFVVGRHAGLYIYSSSDDLNWNLESTHKKGYTPTSINWEKEGEKMLLIGNSEVIRYDLSNCKKPKRHKACKLGKTELCGHFAQRENEIMVVGNTGAKDKFSLGVVAMHETEIKLVNQPKLEYKPRVKFGDITEYIAIKDDYLLILGRESGCFLFKEQA